MPLDSGLADFDFAAIQITSNTNWQTVTIPANWVSIEIFNPPGSGQPLYVGREQTGTFGAANHCIPIPEGGSWRRSRSDKQPQGQIDLKLSIHQPNGNGNYVYMDLSGPVARGPGGV